MAGFRNYKLTDAVGPPRSLVRSKKAGKPLPTHETTAEQTREAQESMEAHDGGPSARDHMVDIGRGNQQSGRQSQ